MDYRIIKIEDADKKAIYTREVLEKLPQWFGNEQALGEYVEKVRELPYWAALRMNDEATRILFRQNPLWTYW